MLDDPSLLRRYAKDKSEAAFAELVARHIDLVYSAALRQLGGDSHQAQDVSQVVFATLARKASSLAGHPALAGWLYNTTQHVARRTVRAAWRRRAREQEASRMNEVDTAAASAAEWERIHPVLDHAMRELGERDREALVLRFFAHRPFAEIGQALGLSGDATRMRVQRALEKLRARLGRHGVTSTAAMLSLVLTQQAVTAAPAAVTAAVAGSALTSATAATGSLFTFVEFMSTSKVAVGGATAAVLLTLGTTLHEVRARAESDEALTRIQSARTATHARLRSVQEQVGRIEAETERLLAESNRAREAAEKARASAVTRRSDADEGEAFLARHPDLKRLAWQQRRAQIAGSYAPLFKLLRLTPAQIERFTELASQGSSDAFTASSGESIRYSLGGDRRQAEAELRVMLGEDGFKLYKNYYDTIGPAWQTTIQLAGDLYHTPKPLTAAQGEQVQRILVEGRVATDWSSRPQFDWPAIIARAQGVLTPEQLAALNDLSAHDRFSQALTRARMRGEIK